MAATKFTPGPWRMHLADKEYLEIRGADDDYVLDIDRSLDEPLTERELADATLISAAPEIYDAINRMLVHWLGDDNECPECNAQAGLRADCDTCYVVSKALVALAKARGEVGENVDAK